MFLVVNAVGQFQTVRFLAVWEKSTSPSFCILEGAKWICYVNCAQEEASYYANRDEHYNSNGEEGRIGWRRNVFLSLCLEMHMAEDVGTYYISGTFEKWERIFEIIKRILCT